MTLQIYIQFWRDILSIWWPVFLFLVVGLAILNISERRGKHGREGNN